MAEKHVRYGGSSAERWLNCAGYAQLANKVPQRPVGIAAIEGTAQHKCMEMLLENPDLDPDKFLGTTVMQVLIRPDHVAALKVALEAYCAIVDDFPEAAQLYSEKFVGLAGPDDAEAGGTMDGGVVHLDKAAIIDFKFGQMEVGAGSEQNLFYAICARKSIAAFAGVKELHSYIIQPAYDPAIDKIIYPESVLDKFEQQVVTAIALSKAPNPHYTEGEWCGWCHAKLACPAKTQRLVTLTAPNHVLDLESVERLLIQLKGWDKWREEAEERLLHELEHGTPLKRWKLVAKRAIRQWVDEAAAIARFKSLKIPATQYMVTKLISPAQAEKVIPKNEVAKMANPVSSGNTIAPIEDKRPAVLPMAAVAQALKKLM